MQKGKWIHCFQKLCSKAKECYKQSLQNKNVTNHCTFYVTVHLVPVEYVPKISARGQTLQGEEKWAYVDVREGTHMFWWLYHSYHADGYLTRPLILWLQVSFIWIRSCKSQLHFCTILKKVHRSLQNPPVYNDSILRVYEMFFNLYIWYKCICPREIMVIKHGDIFSLSLYIAHCQYL